MNAWRPLLRLAWRDVRRRPLRTTLIALVIAVPVVVVTMVNIGMHAFDDDWDLRGEFGRTEAFYEVWGDVDVADRFDGADAVVEERSAALGTSASTPDSDLRTIDALVGDVFSPVLEGVYDLVDGRTPEAGELTVSSELGRTAGLGVGDVVYLGRDRVAVDVVGVHERRNSLDDSAIALPAPPAGTLGRVELTSAYYVDVDAFWVAADATTTGSLGGGGAERSQQQPAERVSPEFRFGLQMGTAAVLLVLALLIAAAFASGARRQLREVGLIAANGADPRQVRQAFALQGAITAAVGLLLGWTIVLGAVVVARDRIDRIIGQRIPYGVQPVDLLVSGALVIGAGALAAWWPARSVSRTPLLSALAGRRPSRPASPGLPVAAVALGLLGMGLLISGFADNQGGTGSANLVVIAIIVLIVAVAIVSSWLVSVTGRWLGRLGGVARVTGRSLDRQRTRTGPLVASIAATAALGVLGVTVQATEAANRSDDGNGNRGGDVAWDSDADDDRVATTLDRLRVIGQLGGGHFVWLDAGNVLIGDEWVQLVDERHWTGDPVVGELLRSGALVMAGASADGSADEATVVTIERYDGSSSPLDTFGASSTTQLTVPIARAAVDGPTMGVRALAAAGLVDDFSASARIDGPVGDDVVRFAAASQREDELGRALGDTSTGAVVFVYDGGQADADLYRWGGIVIGLATMLLVLTALAIGLGLARIEQRDDELLLAALGAAPGFRRRAGALEAATLSGLALVIAVPLGLVLAIAIRSEISSEAIHVPWLALTAMTVGLPLLAALLFGVTRRSPTVIRLDRS